tara:strand:+ start:54 stop:305 length:252 start_codon:yes stop_codon:yes gene_type:complete
MINSFWHPTPSNQSNVNSPPKILKSKGRNYYQRLRMFNTIGNRHGKYSVKGKVGAKLIKPELNNNIYGDHLHITKYPSHGNLL